MEEQNTSPIENSSAPDIHNTSKNPLSVVITVIVILVLGIIGFFFIR
ncbi:MAG: hypothetical protein KBC15_00920 [Candidatus Levybacteria bacterium]|nr:hypothetical protein [Candidatus Levybacteria bacterium]